MTYLIVGIVIWIACGVLSYGLEMAYFTRHYPDLQSDDEWYSNSYLFAKQSIPGPFALVVTIMCLYNSGVGLKFGLMFRKPEKWEE